MSVIERTDAARKWILPEDRKLNMKIEKQMFGLCAVLSALSLTAGTYTWTGAQDACWTNAANWTVGGAVATVPPGLIDTGDAENSTMGDAADAVVFGACAGATAIDLSGLHSIAELTVSGADASQYTFGTAESQVLRFACGGFLTISSDVVQMPIFPALGIGTDITTGMLALTVRNDSAQELVFNKYGYLTKGAGANSWGEAQVKFLGAGPLRFTQKSTSLSGWQLKYVFNGTGRVTLDANLNGTHGVNFRPDGTAPVEVVFNNASMEFSDIYCCLYVNGNVRFTGTGTLVFESDNTEKLIDPSISVAANRTLTLDEGITVKNVTLGKQPEGSWTPGVLRLDSGLLVMEGTLVAEGGLRLRGGTTQVRRMDQVATGDLVEISSGAWLSYVGAGETITKSLVITNGNAVIRHQGTGGLTFASQLVTGPKTGTLTLNNLSSSDAIWSSTATAELPVTLQGVWRLTGALPNATVTLDKSASLSFETSAAQPVGVLGLNGQVLDLSAQARRLGASVLSGANAMKMAAGSTLTSVTSAGGTLNIVAEEGSVAVEGQLAGAAPGWMTLNGRSAGYDANGKLVYLVYPETVGIAARGGVIPNNASAVVGVTTSGEAGAVTLAADAVAVQTLVQKTDVAAVVDLSAGQTLTVGTLARTQDAAALEVGREKGVGTLAVGADGLVLDNPNGAADITVRATVSGTADKVLMKNGPGTAVFDNALNWSGTIQANQGELSVVDPVSPITATLTGPGTYSIGGSGTRTLAGDATGFFGTLLLKGGVTRIKDAAQLGGEGAMLVITNGAALDISGGLEGLTFSQLNLQDRNVFLSGDGPDGLGAFRPEAYNAAAGGENGSTNASWNAVRSSRFTLMDDATIGSPNQTRWGFLNSVFDQQGHTLTFNNAGRILVDGTTVTNAGPIVLAGREKERAGGLMFGPSLLGEADAPAITAYANTHLTWQGDNCRAQVRPLNVMSNVTFYNFQSYKNKVTDTDYNGWSGPIDLVNPESKITLDVYSDANRALRLNGPISGAGSLKLSGNGQYFIMNATNTFTGDLDCSETNWGRWEFGWGSSIPDYSKAKFGTGCVALLADDTNRWTMVQFTAFMNEASFTANGTSIGFDTTLADQRLVLDNLVVTNTSHNEIRNLGPGKIIVEGPGVFPGPALKMAVTGTVEITGTEHVKMENAGDQFTIRPVTGGWRNLVQFRDAMDVELPGANYYVGCWGTSYYGRVRVENSRLYVPGLLGEPAVGGALFVGAAGAQGYVEIEGASSVVSNRVVLGTLGGAGALYLRDGTLVDLGPTGGTYGHVGDGGSYGYLEQTGGSLRLVRAHRIGFSKNATKGRTTGVMALLGGTAECVQWEGQTSGAAINIGVDGAAGHLYMKGGRLTTHDNVLRFGEHNNAHVNGSGILTMEEGASLIQEGRLDLGYSCDFTAILNLNGGVLEANSLAKATTSDTSIQDPDGFSWRGSKGYVNFNGGTFRMRDVTVAKVFDNKLNRITVFTGGATIDTNGRDRTLDHPLEAPEGNGVVSIDTTGLLDREWVGSPYIAIENVGDSAGYGATVYADFDSTTRRVTGVHVVSPGCNYTAAQAVIHYGVLACFTNAVTLGTSASGGLTKTGEGTLTLNCANTFTGAVAVEAGTLKVNADGALPASAPVSVAAGATLDLNGRPMAATSLGAAGGSVKNGTLTLPNALTFDLAAAKAGKGISYAEGAFRFPKGASVTLTNTDVRDEKDRFYTLFKVTGEGTLEGTPTLLNDDLLPWTLVNTGRELRLAFPAGTVLIFR